MRRTIAKAERLQTCELAKCGNLTEQAFLAIFKGCPRLRALSVSTCRGFTDALLAPLAQHCPYAPRPLQPWRSAGRPSACSAPHRGRADLPASRRRQLVALDLSRNRILGGADGLAAVARLAELRTLQLKECKGVRDAGVQAIAAGCRELRRVDLDQCGLSGIGASGVGDDAVRALGAGCAHLEELRAAGSPAG